MDIFADIVLDAMVSAEADLITAVANLVTVVRTVLTVRGNRGNGQWTGKNLGNTCTGTVDWALGHLVYAYGILLAIGTVEYLCVE